MKEYYQSVVEATNKRQKRIIETQISNIEKAAAIMAETWKNGKDCWVFSGAGSDIITQELDYRAGGFVTMNRIYSVFVEFSMRPLPFMWECEKLVGLLREMWVRERFDKDDTLILHSPAGCSAMIIEAVELCHEMGIKVIALTNINLSKNAETSSKNSKRLFEVADVVIDTCGEMPYGCILTKAGEHLCGGDLSAGVFTAHLLEVATASKMISMGLNPPILRSVNKDNAATHNTQLAQQYKDHIFYPCMQGKYATYYQKVTK
ncbi:MAG: sugar isomerase domain-containing protein [Brevinema sp.]